LIEHPELLDVAESPKPNDKSKVDPKAFESKVPPMPEDKQYASDEDRDRLRKLWPPGEEAGMARLEEFLQDKVADYKAHRSNPALDCTSRMSAYFSSGMVGIRKVMARLKEFNNGENDLDAGDEGIAAWVRELVFREFYRAVTFASARIH
jgi:deoxyribodipyrimidine photo-lyase